MFGKRIVVMWKKILRQTSILSASPINNSEFIGEGKDDPSPLDSCAQPNRTKHSIMLVATFH
jgi:hypothetical protein